MERDSRSFGGSHKTIVFRPIGSSESVQAFKHQRRHGQPHNLRTYRFCCNKRRSLINPVIHTSQGGAMVGESFEGQSKEYRSLAILYMRAESWETVVNTSIKRCPIRLLQIFGLWMPNANGLWDNLKSIGFYREVFGIDENRSVFVGTTMSGTESHH